MIMQGHRVGAEIQLQPFLNLEVEGVGFQLHTPISLSLLPRKTRDPLYSGRVGFGAGLGGLGIFHLHVDLISQRSRP
jgi:hypothetical protein